MGYDQKYIYQVSHEFFNTGLRTSKLLFKNIKEEKANHFLIPVAAINLAFCAELALKAISLMEEIEFQNTHKLTKLFERLPASCKEIIVSNFEKAHSWERKDFPVIRLRKEGVEDNTTYLSADENTAEIVNNVLEIHDQSFVYWRYSFEMTISTRPSLHFDFASMLRLDTALLEYLRSKWE